MENKICRQIDELGRLVIPVELRKQYDIKTGDMVCITAQNNGILIYSEGMTYKYDGNKD